MSTLERAIEIAHQVHAGQVDKAGRPYIEHPLHLMAQMQSKDEKIVAVLHDVVEDSQDQPQPWTLERLRQEGFSEPVLSGIDAVTRRPHETYTGFVMRAAEDPIGWKVKDRDLDHNQDLSRLPNPTERDHARVRKYRDAHALLLQIARARHSGP